MLRLCTHGDLAGTERQIDCYAAMGLRTLALGHKTITQQQLDNFLAALDSAGQSIVNRTTFVRYGQQDHFCQIWSTGLPSSGTLKGPPLSGTLTGPPSSGMVNRTTFVRYVNRTTFVRYVNRTTFIMYVNKTIFIRYVNRTTFIRYVNRTLFIRYVNRTTLVRYVNRTTFVRYDFVEAFLQNRTL